MPNVKILQVTFTRDRCYHPTAGHTAEVETEQTARKVGLSGMTVG